jgi:DNA-binding NarL/FixJ family response regulator
MAQQDPIIRLLIADNHRLMLKGIREMIQVHSSLEIVGEVGSNGALLSALKERNPTIVLMGMCECVSMACAFMVQKEFPSIQKIAISSLSHDHHYLQLLEAGFKGIITQTAEEIELIYAIEQVGRGGQYYCPQAGEKIEGLVKRRIYDPVTGCVKKILTGREEDILQLICQGFKSIEIAQKLGLSLSTIDSFRGSLFVKTENSNTASLVVWAVKNGYFVV